MFRTLILIFLFCGLTVLSLFLEYHSDAETYECPLPRVCVQEVKPPDCEIPDCEIERPLLRSSCAHAWRKHLIETVIRCPQHLCFQDVKIDKLETVAMVSTLDILRAIGR